MTMHPATNTTEANANPKDLNMHKRPMKDRTPVSSLLSLPKRACLSCHFVVPSSTMLYVYRPENVYPCYATVKHFDTTAGLYTLEDETTKHLFRNKLQHQHVVIPSDQCYAYSTTTTNLSWLKSTLYVLLTEIQTIRQHVRTNRDYSSELLLLFHKQAHASMLFENINSLPRHNMSSQSRTFNCALLCSLHDMIATHSLYDETMFLTNKQPRIYTTEKTLKKFCFATIALRITTGTDYKVTSKRRSIHSLSVADPLKYAQSMTFLHFFSRDFNDHYTETLSPVHNGLENFDLYKTKHNLIAKRKAPLHNRETPKGGAMHYKHYRIYDNLSASFRIAFLNNVFNLQGHPSQCNNYSSTDRFPLLTEEQKLIMLDDNNQLWNVFETAW